MNLKSLLFSFKGRINRLPYWIVTLILTAIGAGGQSTRSGTGPENVMTAGEGLITLVVFVLVLWIGFAVQVKRWHDRGKSGWWSLLSFVPFIGTIWILIECGFLRGSQGSNRFGPDPLESA